MNPFLAHLIYGEITSACGGILPNLTFTVITSVDRQDYSTNSEGIYLFDLSDIGYEVGETIIIRVVDKFNNELKDHEYTVTGSFSEENITLVVRTLVQNGSALQRQNVLHSVGKTPITVDNTLPIGLFAFNGTNFRGLEQDEITRAMAVIDYAHHEIHEGDHFFVRDFVDLGNSATRDILLISPNSTKVAHLTLEIDHELEGSVKLYETTVTSANGTAIPRINRKRNGSDGSGMLVFHTPTVSAVGTLLEQDQKGSGNKFGNIANRASEEIMLKRNTKYLIRMTNITANNNLFNWTIDWYEHTSKEA